MTKPVWSHVLALSAWTLKKAHISCQEAQTIPDCIRYISGVSLAIILNHRRSF